MLASLLASINAADKQAEADRNESSSIFGYITGASSSRKATNKCQRCQEKEHRYVCTTCSGGSSVGALTEPTKLCEECNTLIHSLGASFKAHKVHESIATKQPLGSVEEQRAVSVLTTLEECPRHGEPIEFYLEDETLADQADIELPGVAYGCLRCTKTLENGANFTKIDKENLLNVY